MALIFYIIAPKKDHYYNGRKFWMGLNNANWKDTRVSCQNHGGDLAVAEDEEIFNFITSGVFR